MMFPFFRQFSLDSHNFNIKNLLIFAKLNQIAHRSFHYYHKYYRKGKIKWKDFNLANFSKVEFIFKFVLFKRFKEMDE